MLGRSSGEDMGQNKDCYVNHEIQDAGMVRWQSALGGLCVSCCGVKQSEESWAPEDGWGRAGHPGQYQVPEDGAEHPVPGARRRPRQCQTAYHSIIDLDAAMIFLPSSVSIRTEYAALQW